MKFENTQVMGIENAILGLRLPMCKDLSDAMKKADSHNVKDGRNKYFSLGNNDLKIAKNLIRADSNGGGQPNSKFLRMIHVQVCITAPLFWWKEADTYKVGTTANSTSTMHTITKYPITKECFEMDVWEETIKRLEETRQKYLETKDVELWNEIISNLPESWLQIRMFDCDYATLRNIYKWRKNHKLHQWHQFCDWIKTLPYAEWLICE